MKTWATILIATMILTGCASVSKETIATAINRCPVLKQYSKEQMLQAAKELRQLPSEAQLAVLVSDYSKLRDACRVAERKLKQLQK
jgi:uncharacterized protein YceK